MSGFDFDALRDPNAPQPGDRERAEVHARARQLGTRAGLRWMAVSAASVVAVVAVVLGVVASQRDNEPALQVEGPSTTAASSVADRFVPPTSIENGIVTVPVTLPDGETLTMRYPEKLRIAQLGFNGSINMRWPVSGGNRACCGRFVGISYTTVSRYYGDAKRIKTYASAHGEPVPFIEARLVRCGDCSGSAFTEQDLAFQFGPWLVRVEARSLSEDQRATWARSLTGTVDGNGYLVLHARAPLAIGNQFDGGFHPIGVGNFVRLSSHSTNRVGRLTCGPGQSDASAHRSYLSNIETRAYSWCVGNDLHIAVGGSGRFVDLANKELQVGPLTPPAFVTPTPTTSSTTSSTTSPTTGPTTTTTTVPRLGAPSFAMSASFVSPDQGWAVEQNGLVAGTTDGGATWSPVGEVGGPSSDRRIRFADANRGFEFSDDPQLAAPILTTADGGVHWTELKTPFSSPYDLAISRGVVYVVARQPDANLFGIWSAPADTLSWTQDPLVIPGGGGPVPQVQLVFSGTHGWLVEVDRIVIAGAQMSTTGHWSAWTPPCSSVNGPAALAASTSSDLVASCSEGVWGPPGPATSVYFSHDGGATFQRHVATRSGYIASPNPQTAVVFDGNIMQRTADEGATWHFVAGLGDNVLGKPDVGFTTPTQGFAILGDGTMLMTHDAGATWQPVKLP